MAVSYSAFMYEFRNLKLECMIKDLHKMTPDELIKIKKEIDNLLDLPKGKKVHV